MPLATDTISSPHPPSTYLPNPYARNKNPQIIISHLILSIATLRAAPAAAGLEGGANVGVLPTSAEHSPTQPVSLPPTNYQPIASTNQPTTGFGIVLGVWCVWGV